MKKTPPSDAPPQDAPPTWWDKAKKTVKVAKQVASAPIIGAASHIIADIADPTIWKAQRWLTVERARSCLREWARIQLVGCSEKLKCENMARDDLVLSAFAYLQNSLQKEEVRLRPWSIRHKPDILIEQSLAMRFLVNPNNIAIDDIMSELAAMAKVFTTLFVICNASTEVQLRAQKKLEEMPACKNLELLCLPGGLPTWPPPSWAGKRIFVSHDNRDDRWAERLRVHLNPLRKSHGFLLWDNSIVLPGDDPKSERILARSTAHIIVIMLSADYLDKEYEELQSILDRAEICQDSVRVLLLYVGCCNLDIFPRLHRHRSINQQDYPLNAMREEAADAVLIKVWPEIDSLLKKWKV